MRTIDRMILSALVVVLAAGSWAAQTPATASAETPPALAPVLKAIREANTLAEAASAYSGAGEAGRKDVALNTAYMRRLLQLGQPQAAGIPAANLASIPVSDGMAYGVLGYNAGRQNDLPKALTNTMKAAGLLKDDASVQNNLGQLVAWNENNKTFKLSAADQKVLDRLKTEMATQKPYMDGYQLIKEGYDKFNEANSANQDKIAAAQTDVADAQKKVADDQAQIKSLTDQVAKLRADLQKASAGRGGTTGRGGRGARGGANPPPMGGGNIQQLNREVADIQNKQLPAAKKTLQDDSAALNLKQQALAKVKAAPVTAVSLAKLFNWLPPAVDGVVTLPPGTVARPTSAPASATGT